MRSNEKLADQVLPKPGTSKIGEMRSNEKLADQVLPRPGTSKIEEYAGQHKNWHTRYSPDLTHQFSQILVFIYPFGTQLLRHILNCTEIGLHVYSHEENIECRSGIISAMFYHKDMIFLVNMSS